MGFAPEQVGRMSLWQFMACAEGNRRANTVEEAMSPAERAEIAIMLDEAPATLH